MPLFRANIDKKGRLIRAAGAVALAVAAAALWPESRVLAAALGLAALFVGFEASRGWCALRACGLKTKF